MAAIKSAVPVGSSFKTLANTPAPRRIIMALDAFERQGKTHFALTAPGPIAYMEMDPGGADVLPKFAGNKQIVHASYYAQVKPGMGKEQIALEVANPIWKRSADDFEKAIASCRSLVVDTATEWFTLLKLAKFGKLTQVMPEDYAPVYAEYRRLLRMAYNHNCNVIFLHKLKAEYERKPGAGQGKGQGVKTGNWVRDGFSGTGYDMQIEARAYKDQGKFCLEILNCRQDPQLDGYVLEGEECTFQGLAAMVYPDSDPKDWL